VGFTALPSGYRGINGNFEIQGIQFSWWSSIKIHSEKCALGWTEDIGCGYSSDPKGTSLPIRCIMDSFFKMVHFVQKV
jgi:uncharacterized protein (TIGR02145 family)